MVPMRPDSRGIILVIFSPESSKKSKCWKGVCFLRSLNWEDRSQKAGALLNAIRGGGDMPHPKHLLHPLTCFFGVVLTVIVSTVCVSVMQIRQLAVNK